MRGDLCCANDFIKTVILLGSIRVRILILSVGGWQPIFTKIQSGTTIACTIIFYPNYRHRIALAHFSRFCVMLLASAG